MKAAVLREVNKPLEIEEVQLANPGPREVLVRTVAAGVCHSDLHFQNGSYPYPLPAVLGHESAGVVEAVGSMVDYVKPGDHIITCLSAFCGHCEDCLTGHMSLCQEPELQRAEGEPPRIANSDETVHQFLNLSSFAEYMLVHEHALTKIREDMPMDRAALIGCGVTTGVGAVIHTASVEPGSTVAVIGCGGVGLSCINGAAIAGAARIIAIDTVPSKLDLARKFGATDVVNAGDNDPIEAVRSVAERVRPGGVITFVEYDSTVPATSLPRMPLREKTGHWIWETLRASGAEVHMGFKLHPVLTAAGLVDVEVRAEGLVNTPTTRYPGSALVRVLLPKMVEFGITTEEEVGIETLEARLQKEIDEAGGVNVALLVFGAWGRCPARA